MAKEFATSDNTPIVGLSKDDILAQIKVEHKMSLDFVKTKRETFRERIKLYNNQRKQRDKIGITTIYTMINTLLAVYYTDKMTVEFEGRELADSEFADNINNTAKFDYDEMDLDKTNYFVQWNRLFYGVGIRDISGYDLVTNTPIVRSIHPLSWLPDPKGGQIENMRFHGFEVEMNRADMKDNKAYFNLEHLPMPKSNDESEQTRVAQSEAYGLDESEQMTKYKHGDFDLIDWYTVLPNGNGGRSKYIITVDPKITELYRIEKLSPVTEEEKKDESKVPWTHTGNYYSPTQDDPFGTSVCDLVEDKQRAKSILANLRIMKEKAALYPMYLYNRNKIPNRRDLDFAFNKSIGVNVSKDESLADVIRPVQKDLNSASTINQEQSLESEARIATGADAIQAGVLSASSRTLGEIQQVTQNAQTRFALGSRVNAWGDKRFWKLWYRMYRQYFSETQEKTIRLQGGFGLKYRSITRKDFITKEDPDVIVASQTESLLKKEKDRLAFSQIAPMVLQDPTKPLASRNFVQRHLLKLHDVPYEAIRIMLPQTPDEMQAKVENELLNMNQLPKIQLDDDHLSHMVIHSAADDTDAKAAHVEAHRRAYIESGQKERDELLAAQMPQQQQAQANQAQAQIANQRTNLEAQSPIT